MSTSGSPDASVAHVLIADLLCQSWRSDVCLMCPVGGSKLISESDYQRDDAYFSQGTPNNAAS